MREAVPDGGFFERLTEVDTVIEDSAVSADVTTEKGEGRRQDER